MENLKKLRSVINESLRVQRGGADPVPYIDVSNVLTDVVARQNHAVFGRRGCGKTLLLRRSTDNLPMEVRSVYLNCEDFKKHSFPNVLIEILDALFAELEKQLSGWFGKKRRSREVVVSRLSFRPIPRPGYQLQVLPKSYCKSTMAQPCKPTG
jgi:hypothetical protein